MENIEWLNEHIDHVPKNDWLYKIMCFLVGKSKKKLTYSELYMVLQRMGERKYGKEASKKYALEQIVTIHELLNNNKENEEEN